MPSGSTWVRTKQELTNILGEANPKDKASETLSNYKPVDKRLCEIASDIMTLASKATDDRETQTKIGLDAFYQAVPQDIGKELRRRQFTYIQEALTEAKLLQWLQEDEVLEEEQVCTVKNEDESKEVPSEKDSVEDCIKRWEAMGLFGGKRERPSSGGRQPSSGGSGCWSCGDKGHLVRQCPIVIRNKTAQGRVVRNKKQGKRAGGRVEGSFLGSPSLLILERVRIAGVEVDALVDTGAMTSCCRWEW